MKIVREYLYSNRLILLASCLSVCMYTAKAQDSIKIEEVVHTNRTGIENVLQGNSAGLQVKSWTGTPGIQSLLSLRSIRIPGYESFTAPLILVNGIPLISSPSSVTLINPLSYYSPDQIERVEVKKNISQLSQYGVLAPNGVINIVTKSGQEGQIRVVTSAFAGMNHVANFGREQDTYYGFNSKARENVYGSTLVHEESVVIDGGGSFGSYLLGFNNHRDGGSVKDLSFQRQSVFFNAKYIITEKFSTEFYNNFSLAARNDRYAGTLYRNLTNASIFDESFFMDKNRNTALLSGLKLGYQFSPELVLQSTLGISYEGSKRDMYVPSNIREKVQVESAAYKRQYITIESQLNYTKELTEKLDLSLSLGNLIMNTENRLTHVDGEKSIEAGGSDYVKLVRGYNANQTNAFSDLLSERLASFYMISSLDINNDMSLMLSLRTDGSSLYQKKWNIYPSIGANYDFSRFNLPFAINASAGRSGMLTRPESYRGELIGLGKYYNNTQLGITQLYHPFTEAKSASVLQIDAGIDFFINKNMHVNTQFFNKRYDKLTYKRYLSNISGTDFQYENSGFALGMTGVEVSFDGILVQSDIFRWVTNLNVAFHKNTILDLPKNIEGTSLAKYSILEKGSSFTSLIVNDKGQQKVVGDSEMNFFGGFSNQFTFHNFSLSAKMVFGTGSKVVAESPASGKPATTPDNDPSKENNGELFVPKISSIENGNFLRLSNICLSYDLSSLIKIIQMRDVSLFVNIDNLYTFTNYSGQNPEENMVGIKEYNLLTTGTPLPASIAFGIKLHF